MIRRAITWTADLEDGVTGDGMRVFVPSIMGAGILVSLFILVGDLRRRIAPKAGDTYRRVVARRRAAALVAPVAAAAGVVAPDPPGTRRRLRSKACYYVVFAATVSLSLYVGIGSTFNYLRRTGPFSGSESMLALALVVSAAFFAVAVMAFVLGARHPFVPARLRWAVRHTPLGAVEH